MKYIDPSLEEFRDRLDELKEEVEHLTRSMAIINLMIDSRLTELRNAPCPLSPNGRHMYVGFAEFEGDCEHCGINGGCS